MADLSRPTIICLTPIKNEAWILDRFLQCASTWADYIIVADQGSEDVSREIAGRYPKVILVENRLATFNELERQRLLLNAARQLPGPRLLIALDADELLTANWADSPEWSTVLRSLPGTVIHFERVNLYPDVQSALFIEFSRPFGFMDDGSDHQGQIIHNSRIPTPKLAPVLTLRDIKVLHYQYSDWERMKSKHRWYQCWERIHHPQRRAIAIYRQYNAYHTFLKAPTTPLPPAWTAGYRQQGIDLTTTLREPYFWWDRELLHWFEKYGAATFRREAIWDVDWVELGRMLTPELSPEVYRDPRSSLERLVHRWLRKTQAIAHYPWVRLGERLLSWIGW